MGRADLPRKKTMEQIQKRFLEAICKNFQVPKTIRLGGIDRVSTSFLLAGLNLGHVMFISFTFPRGLVVGHLNECHPPTIDFEK